MLKKLTGGGLRSPLGLLLPLIVAGLLVQTLFGTSLLKTPVTEMTYTEFKTALRAGQIKTATVGADGNHRRADPCRVRGRARWTPAESCRSGQAVSHRARG